MVVYVVKVLISAAVIVVVSELAKSNPRAGAVLLALPLTTLLAFVAAQHAGTEMAQLTALSKDALVLVPLTLLFYVPFAVPTMARLGFWVAFPSGLFLAALAIVGWLWRSGAFAR